MAKDRSKPLSEITCHCKPCYSSFKAQPSRIEPDPELDYHPYRYFGTCPKCGDEIEQVYWERNLLKCWVNSTGPKTAAGKAAAAANLEGHPTAEESLRTRFNAMKHGAFAKTATYFPAKPDGYSFCSGCDVDRVWCAAQPACVKKTEIFMLHHAAFEQRDPKHLMGIYSDMQAGVFALVQTMVQTIIADGVKIEEVVWKKDEDGNIEVAEYIDEQGQRRIVRTSISAHPLLRQLGELLSRTNLSLADMGMTNKVIEAEEEEMGRLTRDGLTQESLSEYQKQTTLLLQGMAEKVMRANQKTDNDPILIEYNQENGGS